MTAEEVYRFNRAYKLFYAGKWDLKRYGSAVKVAPLIEQRERRLYYRISQRLSDEEAHALFTLGYFFHPDAHVSELATTDAMKAAVTYASRAQGMHTVLSNDLYTLKNRLLDTNLDEWLYGEVVGHSRSLIPPVVQEIINGELATDIACLILLIPQPALQYHWLRAVSTDGGDFGVAPWIDRLVRLDYLLYRQRAAWRNTTYPLAEAFWSSFPLTSLAPRPVAPATVLL